MSRWRDWARHQSDVSLIVDDDLQYSSYCVHEARPGQSVGLLNFDVNTTYFIPLICVFTKVSMSKLRIASGQHHYTGHPDLQLLLQPHTRGSILRKSSLTVLDFVFCPQIDNNVQKQNTDKMFRTI